MANRVLVIGIDGATWKVLNPLIQKGQLPFFEKIKKNGSHGILESTTPPLTAPAWVSFQTGVNPGKHGVFGFADYRSNPESPDIVNSENIKSERIWDLLEENDLKSLIINMPVTYPLNKTKSIVVSSFLTPPKSNYVYPKKYQKLLEKIDYEIDIMFGERYGHFTEDVYTKTYKKEIFNKLVEISQKRVEAFKLFLKEGDFSLFFILFKESDLIQHMFWGTKDVEKYFKILDSKINNLFEYFQNNISGKKTLIIMSDHGFHKASALEFSPYAWLKENRFIKKESKKIILIWNSLKSTKSLLNNVGIKMEKYSFVKKLKRYLISEGTKTSLLKESILVTNEGIYFINMKKKKRQKLNKKISRLLNQVTYRKKKVFKSVKDAKHTYYGYLSERGPDIVWQLTEDYFINLSPFSDEVFTKRKVNLPGHHVADPKGIYIAFGDKIRQGIRINAKIYDIFPLILDLLRVKIPIRIDGNTPNILKGEEKLSEEEKVKKNINQEIEKLGIYKS